jgi:CHAT domain-containing protein
VVISQVSAGSNAEQHGLKPDDVLLSYAGTKLNNSVQLRSAVEARQKAQPQGKERTVASVPLQVWRGGKVQDLTVRPGLLGVELSPLTPAEAILAKRSGDRAVQRSRGMPFAPLPGTRIETQAIARLFPESLVLLGADASARRLALLAKADQLRQYRYLHLATHGIVNHRIALYSALLLAQGPSAGPTQQTQGGPPFSEGRLTAEEILQSWKLDADLVVLSVCQSALGKQAGGEGYLGFTQALFLAGARSLVLSLWKVDDTATELLMVRFYENLLGKREGLSKPLPKAEALREAKKWLRELPRAERDRLAAALQQGKERGPLVQIDKPVAAEGEGPPYAHPYYWAAFVLYGDPK